MEFKGTKEEWYVENLNSPNKGKYPAFEIDISSESQNNICTVWYADLFSEEAKANALLVSKAPEMLEMLIEVLENKSDVDYEKIEILIKSATQF
jgi:hypothetical protein